MKVLNLSITTVLIVIMLTSCKNKNESFFDKSSIRGIKIGSSLKEAENQINTKFKLHDYGNDSFKLLTYTSTSENWKVDGMQMIDIFYKFYNDRLSSVLFVFPWNDAELIISNIKKRIYKFEEYKTDYRISYNGVDYDIETADGKYISEVGDDILLIMSRDGIYGKLTIADKKDFFEITDVESKILASVSKGFRGISWGQNLNTIHGDFYDLLMSSEGKRFKTLRKKDDAMRFGGAHVRSIEYGFWDNKFYSVRVIVDKVFIDDFKKAFSREYGDIIRETKTGEFVATMGNIEVFCQYALNDKSIFIFRMTDTTIDNEKRIAEKIEFQNRENEKNNMPTGF